MRSAVLQFLLAGALVVAWIWMLGRPLLTMLARRSRRDSVGHFRYQQAALGRTVGLDPLDHPSPFSPLRPLVEWRAQPLERRRLQSLLGSALATFAAALLAIAMRGGYVRLLLLMAIGFTLHVLVAAWVGSRELRAGEAEQRRRNIDAATRSSVDRSAASVGAERAGQGGRDEEADGTEDLLSGDGLGGGLFDDGFFEPIPELEPRANPGQPGGAEPAAAAAGDTDQPEPTFTNPAAARPSPQRRPKGRPIYVEPEPEEGDESVRAVND